MSNVKKRKHDDTGESVFLEHQKIRKTIEALNKKHDDMKFNWFVCFDCQKLTFGDTVRYLATTKYGDDRPFCIHCTMHCAHCHQIYCSKIEHKHDHSERETDE